MTALVLILAIGAPAKSGFPATPPGFEKQVQVFMTGSVRDKKKVCEQLARDGESSRPMVPWLVYLSTNAIQEHEAEAPLEALAALGHTAQDAAPELTRAFWSLGKWTKEEMQEITETRAIELREEGRVLSFYGPLDRRYSQRARILATLSRIDPEHSLPLVLKVCGIVMPHAEVSTSASGVFLSTCISCIGVIGSDSKESLAMLNKAERYADKHYSGTALEHCKSTIRDARAKIESKSRELAGK